MSPRIHAPLPKINDHHNSAFVPSLNQSSFFLGEKHGLPANSSATRPNFGGIFLSILSKHSHILRSKSFIHNNHIHGIVELRLVDRSVGQSLLSGAVRFAFTNEIQNERRKSNNNNDNNNEKNGRLEKNLINKPSRWNHWADWLWLAVAGWLTGCSTLRGTWVAPNEVKREVVNFYYVSLDNRHTQHTTQHTSFFFHSSQLNSCIQKSCEHSVTHLGLLLAFRKIFHIFNNVFVVRVHSVNVTFTFANWTANVSRARCLKRFMRMKKKCQEREREKCHC